MQQQQQKIHVTLIQPDNSETLVSVNMADVHKFMIENREDDGSTPLHNAVHKNKLGLVTKLVRRRVNINAVDKGGYTPLHMAAKNDFGQKKDGQLDMVKYLVNRGANVNACAYDNWTPLHDAVGIDVHFEIPKYLVSRGANVNAMSHKGISPLHYAAQNARLNAVTFLLSHGANVDAADILGYTPLHYAVKNGHLNVAKYLLIYGANVNAANKDGLTPVRTAVECAHMEMAQFLVKYQKEHCPNEKPQQMKCYEIPPFTPEQVQQRAYMQRTFARQDQALFDAIDKGQTKVIQVTKSGKQYDTDVSDKEAQINMLSA